MLYFVFFVLVTVASVTPRVNKVIYVTIEPERAPILFNIFKNCADKFGVDSKIMQKILEWKFEDNELENKCLHCFENISGYGDDNGHLVKEKFLKIVGDHKSKDEFGNAIAECNKLKGNNKYDNTFKILDCFRNTSPILFKL